MFTRPFPGSLRGSFPATSRKTVLGTFLGIALTAFTALPPVASAGVSTDVHERSFDYGPAELTAYWRPVSSHVLPVVVMVHGGGWRRGSRDWLDDQARYIARRGYQVFNLDYRLKVPWPAPRDDLAAAYDWIRARADHFAADMSRVVLFGESAGGQLVTSLGTLGHGGLRFRGVVGMSPVADPRTAYEDGARPDASAHDKLLREAALVLAGGCAPAACPATWRSMASKTEAGRHDPPMLLVHADREWVPAKHSTELCVVLTRNDVPCTVRVYPGSGHAMDLWDVSRDAVMAFIDAVTTPRTNPPLEDRTVRDQTVRDRAVRDRAVRDRAAADRDAPAPLVRLRATVRT